MNRPKTHLDLVVREGRAVRVLVIETTGEPVDECPSSTRLRKAAPAPEFSELAAWTRKAQLARGGRR